MKYDRPAPLFHRVRPWRCVWSILAVIFGVAATAASSAPTITMVYDAANPQIRFAAGEIQRALVERGASLSELRLPDADRAPAGTRLWLTTVDQRSPLPPAIAGIESIRTAGPQAYVIRVVRRAGETNLVVIGTDATGAMYGGLDLAEAIRLGTLSGLTNSDHRPHIERRGIKFNIPLDLRTPSYSDCSDAFQANIPEMWSLDFWREFLDELARHRFNVLTLWSLHPFPSIVKVPEYPDVALDDIWRTRVKLDDTFSHSGSDMVRPAMLEDVEVVRRMTIGEKIQFWREVMQHAHDRGIEVYWFTWNIFTFGATGKYGITPSPTNRATIDYFRASVRETVLSYPLLAGMGITAGEQMPRRDDYSKERWLWEVYGEGIRDALKLQPGRQFRLVHRYHMTAQSEILREWKEYPNQFDLSFKYAIAHMYSVTNPPFIQSALPHLSPQLRTWLTVRNDDIYSFRWGDPEFARGFIRSMPGPDKCAGFYLGPDGYCWGREFLSTEPETPRQLVIKKQWYSFLLWGRLSYEPDLPDALFKRTLAVKYPEVPADRLFEAWAAASRIFPQITRFFWGDIDLRWLPEACLSDRRHKGFYTVRHFIDGNSMPESGVLNIREWRERLLRNAPMNGVTPSEVTDNLRRFAGEALRDVAELRPRQGNNKELRLTLGDIESFAHLGNYYAEKILGAADLALFDASGEAAQKESAVRHLQSALDHWKRYSAAYTRQNIQPVLYNRVGWVDIPGLITKVEQDMAIARDWKPGTIQEPDPKDRRSDTPFRP